MEKSRQRSSISFCLVLHVLFHLVAAVTAQAERHQVLDGAEGLWEPRFRSIIGVDDGDNKNDLEKGKKAKTMEEIGDYSKNKGIEPMEIIVNGIEGTNMTQRVSKRMAETCALRNLSADFSYLCSLKIPLGKLDALPSHADPGNFTTVLKMIGDGASSRKVTRHQISTVIPRLVSILSWVKRQKDGKGAHGPTHSLPQMLYSVKTISHPVAFPGEMVRSSQAQKTDLTWGHYQTNLDHRRMRRTTAYLSQQNMSITTEEALEMCGQNMWFITRLLQNGITVPDNCLLYICFSKEITAFSWEEYGSWFNDEDRIFKKMCYSQIDDCSTGRYYMKYVMISATEKILVPAHECTHIAFLHVFLFHHRVKLSSKCLLFLCSSNNIQHLSIQGLLLFYSIDPLASEQLGCLSSILESVDSDGETRKGNNFDAADDSGCYNEAATLTYGVSSDFPFEEPCTTASITISIPSQKDMVIFVRGNNCTYFDDKSGWAILTLYFQGRRPIESSSLYTCLTKKGQNQYSILPIPYLGISAKYILAKAHQDGVISEQMADLCCHNETSLVSVPETTGIQHIFFTMNGRIKSWSSYDNFIKNFSSFTTTIETNSPLPKEYSIPKMKSQVLPMPMYNKMSMFFLYTDWVSWCPQPHQMFRDVNIALSVIALYDPELSKACQNILCNGRVVVEAWSGIVERYFWYSGPLSAVDKNCLDTARVNKALYQENNKYAIFDFSNRRSFPPITIIYVKDGDQVWLRMLALGEALTFFLRKGNRKYVDCLSSLVSEQTTKSSAHLFFVNGTQWRLCTGEGMTRTSGDGHWDWTGHIMGGGARASVNSSSLWPNKEENDSHQSNDDSLKDWFEIFDLKYGRVYGISKRLFGKEMEFLAFLLQANLRFNRTTLEDLVTRYRATTVYKTSSIFVFEMPFNIYIGHPIVKENEGVMDCTNTHFYSTCRNIIGQSLMFVHNCSVSYDDDGKIFGMYLASIRYNKQTIDICSSNTLIFSSQLLDRKKVLYTSSGTEEAIEKVLPRVKKMLHGWILEPKTSYKLDFFNFSQCITVIQESRLVNTIRMGFCVKTTVDTFKFYFKRAFNRTLNVFMVDTDRNRNIHSHIGLIRSLTGLDVNRVDTYRIKQKCYSSLGCRNRDIRIILYEADLGVIIANLKKWLGVDTKTLLTDVKYKWSLRSHLQTAVNAISSSRISCMSDMIEGKSVIYRKDNITFIRGIVEELSVGSCFTSLPESVLREIDVAFLEKRGTINKFWPACGIQDAIVIGLNPSSSEWFYLSNSCRLKQIFLFLITLTITLITIFGNLFSLFIIHRYDMALVSMYGPPFYILRSLAVADLLTGLFPGLLAVWDQVSLMTGYMTLYDLQEDGLYGSFFSQRLELAEGFQDLRFERHGYPMFCGLVMSVTSIVSLLMLLLLSVDRYKGVNHQTFRCLHVVVSVWVSWVLSILFGILMFIRKDGFNSAGYFDPISKLTLSIGSSGTSVSQLIFYLEIVFVSFAGCGMIFFTFYTLYIFVGFRTNREKSNITLTIGKDHDIHQHDRKYFLFFFLLVLLYVLSCFPLAANMFGGLSQSLPIFQFLAWWLFMAGSSWNWYIYIYVRKAFQTNVNKWIERRQMLQDLQNL